MSTPQEFQVIKFAFLRTKNRRADLASRFSVLSMPKVGFILPTGSKSVKFFTIREADCSILSVVLSGLNPFYIMSLFNAQQENILTAFVTALAQQDESLPQGLQQQLHAIGQNLEARIVELPTIAASLPHLNQAYQSALANAQTNQDDQGATLVSTNQDHSTKLRDRAVQILTDPDPVQAAQRSQSRGLGQIASNPLKRIFGRG
jgi:hypothetical protein